MTEAQWFCSKSPSELLVHIGERASNRKVLLFALACCRHIWHLLPNDAARNYVQTTEQYIDGLATETEVSEADAIYCGTPVDKNYQWGIASEYAMRAVEWTCEFSLGYQTWEQQEQWSPLLFERLGTRAAEAFGHKFTKGPHWLLDICAVAEERAFQAVLVRDIFGNPFQTVDFDPNWLTSSVVELAKEIYAEQKFGRMPLLATLLKDAGCENQLILDHCRSGETHALGCWVLDRILGKEWHLVGSFLNVWNRQ